MTVHSHKCSACGAVWSHDNAKVLLWTQQDNLAFHTCPACKHVPAYVDQQWYHYTQENFMHHFGGGGAIIFGFIILVVAIALVSGGGTRDK